MIGSCADSLQICLRAQMGLNGGACGPQSECRAERPPGARSPATQPPRPSPPAASNRRSKYRDTFQSADDCALARGRPQRYACHMPRHRCQGRCARPGRRTGTGQGVVRGTDASADLKGMPLGTTGHPRQRTVRTGGPGRLVACCATSQQRTECACRWAPAWRSCCPMLRGRQCCVEWAAGRTMQCAWRVALAGDTGEAVPAAPAVGRLNTQTVLPLPASCAGQAATPVRCKAPCKPHSSLAVAGTTLRQPAARSGTPQLTRSSTQRRRPVGSNAVNI